MQQIASNHLNGRLDVNGQYLEQYCPPVVTKHSTKRKLTDLRHVPFDFLQLVSPFPLSRAEEEKRKGIEGEEKKSSLPSIPPSGQVMKCEKYTDEEDLTPATHTMSDNDSSCSVLG